MSNEVGSLRLESTPAGALVFQDGVYLGYETPVTIDGLSVGHHRFELRFDAYDGSEDGRSMTVDILAGQTVRLVVDLSQPVSATGAAPPAAPASVIPTSPTGKSVGGGRRFLAAFIDYYLVGAFIAFCLSLVLSANSAMLAFGTYVLCGSYVLLRDGIVRPGQSLGKFLLGYHVRTAVGRAATLEDSAARNWPLALPMLLAGFLGYFVFWPLQPLCLAIGAVIQVVETGLVFLDSHGLRLGDRLAGSTTVLGAPRGGALPPGKGASSQRPMLR